MGDWEKVDLQKKPNPNQTKNQTDFNVDKWGAHKKRQSVIPADKFKAVSKHSPYFLEQQEYLGNCFSNPRKLCNIWACSSCYITTSPGEKYGVTSDCKWCQRRIII